MSAAPLVELSDVTKDFAVARPGSLRRATLRAVQGVDLRLDRGECVGLVGESGCGKTTLGRLVAGLDRPTSGAIAGTAGEARCRVQMIFQDATGALDPRYSVAEAVAEPLLLSRRGQRRAGVGELVRGALEAVELPAGVADRLPSELSGGQRQRVNIARAIVVEPELIVCDEPVSALDVSVQAQILNLLRRLQVERGMAYLFIGHGLAAVRYISDRIAVMYLGKVVEEGPVDEVFERPAHPYTRALLDSHPSPAQDGRGSVLKGELPDPLSPPEGCAFRSRCPRASDRCLEEPAELTIGAVTVRCHHPLIEAVA